MNTQPQKKREPSKLEITLNSWATKLTPIKFAEKILFVDHLQTMVSAGLSLVEALDVLGKEMSNKKLQSIILSIRGGVEKGTALSEVLALHPKVFPPIYVKMVASGEMSGKLEESLKQITSQMKKSQALASSIRGAMIYPAVILTAMLGIGILMTTVVLPKLMDLFKEFHAELPLATRVLIVIIGFLSNPIKLTIVFVTTIGMIVTFIYLLKRNKNFRHAIHTLNLHLPIIGPVIKKINLAEFSLTLSSLLKSTIPIIEAVEISAETCGNANYEEALKKAAVQIKSGEPLSQILHTFPKLFPPMVTEMIMVGERSGQVDKMLDELSQFFGDEVDKTMKNFSVIIEPIIIFVLGVAVAGIAVAIIMPMYSLVQDF